MKKKSVISIIVVAILAIGAVVYVGSNHSKTTPVTASGQPIKITLWTGITGNYQKSLQNLANSFNSSQKKYQVVLTSQTNYQTLNQKILAAAKSGTLPVMGMATYTSLADYKHNGFIQNINDFYKTTLSSNQKNDLYPSFLSGTKVGSDFYSIPFSKSLRIMYVNNDILKKYNLTVPTTWEEMAKEGQILKSHGIYAYGFDASFQSEWEGMLHAAGINPVSASGQVDVNNPKAIEAAKVILDMVKDHTAKSAGSDIFWTKNFVNGKSAFYIGSSAGLSITTMQAPKNLNWSTTQVPSYQGSNATEVAGNDLVVFKGATLEQKAGAYSFMKYLLEPQNTTTWAKDTGYVPVDQSAVKSDAYQAYLHTNPRAVAAVNALPNSFSQTSFVGFNQYYTMAGQTFNNMLTTHVSAETALNKLANQTKQIISNNK
ncbi:extracellular solute-binding protein [Periweissella fabalis]|uniref:Extracellular solute-binding protein n=1 Tax=Periweissella fabalis TaxID=1070421 RepID=A0A7X6N2Q9_9LACO|nr:extracellular solute-binding protein [Periweissella fabalis]MCM0598170.1 extracellular solute-binding protein [Periweissella fabalis]NKZ24706.1 extracellular solute-binding protein [Periweissella fabalis]